MSQHLLIRIIRGLRNKVLAAAIPYFARFKTNNKTMGNTVMTSACSTLKNETSSSMTDKFLKKRFLVIEDDGDIASLMQMHLEDLQADVTIASDGVAGFDLAQSEPWDAIMLDLQLPGMDGLDLCRQLRASQASVPVMMVTSRSTELDRVLGLEIGADDYLVKPFSVAELKARVKALLRRSAIARVPSNMEKDQQEVQIRKLCLNKFSRSARLGEDYLELTAKEFDLLWFFASQPGKVFKRSELLDQVWGYGHDGYEHTVNSHINRLRSKLELDPANPEYIQTVWGVGYKFAA